MARNGSGTYSLPAGNPVVTGTTISSTWANNTLSDIATALTASIANDGQTPILANQNWGNFDITNIDLLDATTIMADQGTFANIEMAGSFLASGAGKMFSADFTNGVLASRFAFQTSTLNSNTSIPVRPNGAGNGANITFFNISTMANSAIGQFGINSTDVRITSGHSGSGTPLPLAIYADNGLSAQMEIDGVWAYGKDVTFNARAFSPIGVAGKSKNFAASATGLNANITLTSDAVMLEASGLTYTARTVSLTINLAGSGANGLDTGSSAGSTWYSLWVIYNPATNTVAGLASLSATSPTMPAGYTYRARVGWCRTDGTANKYPLSFIQAGNSVQYKVAANVAGLPIMASGAAGNIATPTYVAVSISNYVPSTAGSIEVLAVGAGLLANTILVAPNNNYGSNGSVTNPPPLMTSSSASNNAPNIPGEIILQSTNIYWASTHGNSAIACIGWEDNI